MSLSLEEVTRIARLARIALNPDETVATQAKLNGIFALIEQMQAVDTAALIPLSHPQDLVQRLRQDVVTESDQREAFQALAPAAEAGLYLVPKVIE